MTSQPQHETAQLPVPLAPELLLAVHPDKGPIIVDIAPRLASSWLVAPWRNSSDSLWIRCFRVMPGLPVVVEEVLRSGRPVHDYRLTYTDHDGVQHTAVLQAGARAGAPGQPYRLVGLRLEEVPQRAHSAEEDTKPRSWHGLLGQAPAFVRVLHKIELYGPTDAPVLITGETGTGKEVVARALHECSQRRQKPFVAVNCAALSEELLESELFGHEKGAFTSAIRAPGRFERAMVARCCSTNWRYACTIAGEAVTRTGRRRHRTCRWGARNTRDVRVEATTNVPLEAVQTGAFRPDLYHRLAVLRIHMPPLRQRITDLPLLVAHFLDLLNQKYAVRRLTPDAMALLSDYVWPGNIRELRNVLERVYVETVGEVIGRKAFDEWVEEREQFSLVPGMWRLGRRRWPSARR